MTDDPKRLTPQPTAQESRDLAVPSLKDTFQYDWNGHLTEGLARLTRLVNDVRREGPKVVRVRDVIAYFGYSKRGAWLLRGIDKACDMLHARFSPTLDEADFLGETKISEIQHVRVTFNEQPEEEPALAAAEVMPARALVKIGDLPSAGRGVVSVNPQSKIGEAWGLMTLRGYSQLPVMQDERRVDGVVSWQSLGLSLARGRPLKPGDEVKQHMGDLPHTCRSSESLLTVMSMVVEREFVLVQGADRRITGIVTTTDLSEFLREKYEPFSILSEIELALRLWIARLQPEAIRNVRAADSPLGAIESVDDLNFGEYKAIIEKPENWTALAQKVDRGTFCKELEAINGIRNDVMHFDTRNDDDESSRVERLRAFLNGLQALGLAR